MIVSTKMRYTYELTTDGDFTTTFSGLLGEDTVLVVGFSKYGPSLELRLQDLREVLEKIRGLERSHGL